MSREYQKCPVCDGTGRVLRPPHIAGYQPTWGTHRRCGGTGTILTGVNYKNYEAEQGGGLTL